ncbi:hypothetical protein HYC85_008418 [Camellia sinensis]|uniref:Retrotransposon Copia-like N-terminal domain-containing protein n=1 Tax=Camellia sinensis TaxID=4442 RepID=A0A7J7HRS4_CAMSI|nr:hypothetical protein HYC85_008418 [Camellia sinensis]
MGDSTINKDNFKDSFFFGSMTNTTLKGSNYLQWSRATAVFLKACGKASYFMANKPSETTKVAFWEQKDVQIMTWLWNSLAPEVFTNVSCLESFKDIWDILKKLYSSEQNLSRIYQLY